MKNWPYLLLIVFIIGCGTDPDYGDDIVFDIPEEPSVKVYTSDEIFKMAKDSAQSELPYFVELFNQHFPDTNFQFIIKSPFGEKDSIEYMWSEIVAIDDTNFVGLLVDNPVWVKNLIIGDTVITSRANITDWILYDYPQNAMVGGFIQLAKQTHQMQ